GLDAGAPPWPPGTAPPSPGTRGIDDDEGAPPLPPGTLPGVAAGIGWEAFRSTIGISKSGRSGTLYVHIPPCSPPASRQAIFRIRARPSPVSFGWSFERNRMARPRS